MCISQKYTLSMSVHVVIQVYILLLKYICKLFASFATSFFETYETLIA